jgi:hypothetical protein
VPPRAHKSRHGGTAGLCQSDSRTHQHYKDILDRIDEPPVWFDDYGVPGSLATVPGQHLASEPALGEVPCQACGRMFKVALTEAFTTTVRLQR